MRVLVLGIVGCLFFVGALAVHYSISTTISYQTITVVSKERLMKMSTDSDGNTSSKWTNYVYSDQETYVVADSLWNWHFRAMTVWAQIPDGEATCVVKLAGIRNGFFSMFQNIIEADCQPLKGSEV